MRTDQKSTLGGVNPPVEIFSKNDQTSFHSYFIIKTEYMDYQSNIKNIDFGVLNFIRRNKLIIPELSTPKKKYFE